MFDISWGELILIGMVALIVIGPKELPTVLRTVGQWVTKVRRMASEFQGQFNEAMREAELSELKKQFDTVSDPTKGFADYNPLETARKEMESAFEDKPAAAATPSDPLAPSDAPPAPPSEAASVGVDPAKLTDTPAGAAPVSPAEHPATPEPAAQTASSSPAPAEPVPAATQPEVGGGRAA